MIPLETLALFVPAALALNLAPGPDMMFCFAQGLKGGPRVGLAADFGVALGGMIHVTAAGLGLAALLASTPEAMAVLRWGGAAYLLWLAWSALNAPPVAAGVGNGAALGSGAVGRAFRQGLTTNLLNPKFLIFVMAFLPQFVDPERGPVLPQFLILGTILNCGGLIVNGLVGVFAGGFGKRLATDPRSERVLRRVSASVFAAMAVGVVLRR